MSGYSAEQVRSCRCSSRPQVIRSVGECKIVIPLGELLLGLELAVVFLDECLDLRSAGKNAKPLFLVEGDGETSHSVEGYGAFLADLETQPC